MVPTAGVRTVILLAQRRQVAGGHHALRHQLDRGPSHRLQRCQARGSVNLHDLQMDRSTTGRLQSRRCRISVDGASYREQVRVHHHRRPKMPVASQNRAHLPHALDLTRSRMTRNRLQVTAVALDTKVATHDQAGVEEAQMPQLLLASPLIPHPGVEGVTCLRAHLEILRTRHQVYQRRKTARPIGVLACLRQPPSPVRLYQPRVRCELLESPTAGGEVDRSLLHQCLRLHLSLLSLHYQKSTMTGFCLALKATR